jgi:RHS repeat-associated protein
LTVSYKYDALGRRIQRTTSAGADERFVYDGQDVLLDLNSSGAVTTSYLNGPGMDNHLRQTNTTTGVSYFLTDHLGTTTSLTDGSGTVVETLNYDSFGNNAGSARTRYTYTGRERDSDTGLLYYRARFYDPQLGRFISEDPIGLNGGINVYAYVGNNPAKLNDPTGLCAEQPDMDDCTRLMTNPGPWHDFVNEVVLADIKNISMSDYVLDVGPQSAERLVDQLRNAGWWWRWDRPNMSEEHAGGLNLQREVQTGRWIHITVIPHTYEVIERFPRRPKKKVTREDWSKPPKTIQLHCERYWLQPTSLKHLAEHLWHKATN